MSQKTQFDTNVVERYKNGESSREIAEGEDYSYNAVLRELKRRGIDVGSRFWDEKEVKRLKKLYPKSNKEELLEAFSSKTEKQIKSKAHNIVGLKRKKHKEICKECGREYMIKKLQDERLCPKCVKRRWDQENPEKAQERKRRWAKENPEKIREKNRRWIQNNLDHINQYRRQRRKENPKIRIEDNISSAMYHALKGQKEGRKWEELVGYTLEELMQHLEEQFKEEMCWNNYGSYWHVDHIKPKSSFDYNSPEDPEFKECWALSNLQPLEETVNLKKQDKFPWNNN